MGSAEGQNSFSSRDKGKSSATQYLWAKSAVLLRRRRAVAPTVVRNRVAPVERGLPTIDSQIRTPRRISSCSSQQGPSRASSANSVHRTRDCYFIILLAFLVITGSAAVGIYFSIARDRMGDGFTAASYILAAGTFVLGPWIACHFQTCNCWTAIPIRRRSHNNMASEIALVHLLAGGSVDVS